MTPFRPPGGDLSRSLPRLWLAVRVGIRALSLPLLIRIHAVPDLLRGLAGDGAEEPSDPGHLAGTVRIVTRVCRLGLFDLPIFPRPCLRRSLVLYAILTREGYPARIHFGVRSEGSQLHGHSWVTVRGIPLGESAPPQAFRAVYSHPSVADHSPLQRSVEAQPVSMPS
jgi:hypothetical protein